MHRRMANVQNRHTATGGRLAQLLPWLLWMAVLHFILLTSPRSGGLRPHDRGELW